MPLCVRAAPHATAATRESRRPACEHLRERLNFYDVYGELALYAHHPQPDIREAAQDHIARLLSALNHLDGLVW
jgi:hypothetical protein